MTKLLALTLACLALGLVAAGCGGDDNGGGDSSGDSPKDLTVKTGETITFTNDESIPHDVHKTSGPGDDFSSGDTGGMGQGDTFKLTLDKPGKYEYVCNVHAPGMAGSITVK